MYRYCIYGHCYSLCKQIKLLMSKILNMIGKKKKLLERKMGRKKSKINWSLLYSECQGECHILPATLSSSPRQSGEHSAISCRLLTVVHLDYYRLTIHCTYTMHRLYKPYTLST